MAPSRGKGKARVTSNAARASSRATRSSRAAGNAVPSIYQDLLSELDPSASHDLDTERPLKKRRVATGASMPQQGRNAEVYGNKRIGNWPPLSASQQTIEDSSQSDVDEEDDDLAFEDVDLEQAAKEPGDEDEAGIQDLSISVEATTTPNKRSQANRTKPITASEKAFRVMVHKMHILCLLGHCMYVNSWCNNEVVQRHLKSKLSKRTVSYLNPDRNESQFQRNRSFVDGLQQASEAFRGAFQITASGLRRAKWAVEGEQASNGSEIDPIDLADFIKSAKEMKGSQDVGNHLFCAMLRAVGVEARLVCSLQVLPFANVPAKTSTPQKYTKPTYYASLATSEAITSDSNTKDKAVGSSKSVDKVPSARRRIGQPGFNSTSVPSIPMPQKRKPIRKLAYPVFWIEAFNTAQQKWIALDPLVTQTVNKPSKLEPPSTYDLNQLTYAIAFEPSNTARDVTRRYTKSYNAKTRRHRIESTENGPTWLRKALRIFRRRGPALDREQVEDAELAQKEAKEGLPNNVQDFKDHPYYALERHLKRHEVLHPPGRSVGKVNAGTAAKPRMEVVFRREDVRVCWGAEKWFRVGRVVREGEQPLKRVVGRVRGGREESGDGERGEMELGVALYAEFQTEPYIPRPVIGGKVPRNAYGNLDIYVSSMVPSGGVHVRHSLTQQAAKILKIDAVDAVTGFQFKGRHGTAIVEGAVVAEQYADAIRAVIDGLEDDRVEEESKARSAMALGAWKRFLVGLRIKERVNGYVDSNEVREEVDVVELEEDRVADAGGFFPGETWNEVAMPTAGRFSLVELSAPSKKSTAKGRTKSREDDTEDEAEFTAESDDEQYTPAKRPRNRQRPAMSDESEDEYMPDAQPTVQDGNERGGGFLPDDADELDDGGGGFLPPDHTGQDDSGGEFLPDDDDVEQIEKQEMAQGGFLAEEQRHLLPTAEFVELDNMMENDGRGVLSEDDGKELPAQPHPTKPATDSAIALDNSTNEASVVDGLHENEYEALGGEGQIDLPRIKELHEAQYSPILASNGILQNNIQEVEKTHEADHDDEDASDQGSMMSHDPDDEDAEPDWLEYESS